MAEMRELLRYKLKPLQIGIVVSKQSDQIHPRLWSAASGHAPEEHAAGTKLIDFGTERLFQKRVDGKDAQV